MIPPSEDEQKTYILLLYNVKKEPATVGTVAGESVGLPVLTGQPRSVRDNGNYIYIISRIPPNVKKCADRGAKIKI